MNIYKECGCLIQDLPQEVITWLCRYHSLRRFSKGLLDITVNPTTKGNERQ